MDFKNRTFLSSLAATLGVVIVAGLGIVAIVAQQGPPPGRGPDGQGGPGGRGPGMGMMGRGPGGPMAGMMMRGLGQLDLTDQQKADIKKVMESNRDAAKAIAGRMIAAREALGDTATADTINEADIRAKATALGLVEADAALLRAKAHAQVFALLTPEQQAKAKQLRTEGKGHMKQMLGRGMGRGMGRGGRGPGGGGLGNWF